MISFKLILIIIITLVVLDKMITYANLSLVKQNFPNVDSLKVEKNIVARWFFSKFGLLLGSIIFGLVTIATTAFAYLMISRWLGESISLYILFILYGFVIFNNLYFLLKYARIIP